MVSKHVKISKTRALTLMLVPFLLVGCAAYEKACVWLGIAAEMCNTIDKIKERCND